MKNIFSQITFNFQRIAYKNTAKLNIKIFFANQTYASISDIYIFFRYRRPICKSNAIRLVHQTIKKTPGQFRRKAKTLRRRGVKARRRASLRVCVIFCSVVRSACRIIEYQKKNRRVASVFSKRERSAGRIASGNLRRKNPMR